MIKVRKINGEEMVINAELIETIRATPDTLINLSTGKKFLVQNGVDEVVEKVINYRRKVMSTVRVEEV